MSHKIINCTCKNRLGYSLLPFTLIPQYFKRFNWSNWKQNSEIHSAFACSHCLHDFLIFSNRTAHAWSMEAGNVCSVSVFFVRVGSQISPRRAKKDSNIPSPGRTRSVKCPTPGTTKTIKSPPHALPSPRRLYIDRCIIFNSEYVNDIIWYKLKKCIIINISLVDLMSRKKDLGSLVPLSYFGFPCYRVWELCLIDSLGKLQHLPCLDPVKVEVSGFPIINYPTVRTEEPESQPSALCSKHSELAREKNIPTNPRAFIHDYCQVPKNQDFCSVRVHLSEDKKIKETRDKRVDCERVAKIELNDLRHCFIFPSLDYY